MVRCPDGLNAFEFCVIAGLRAAQLQRGCTPRVAVAEKIAVTALREVSARTVVAAARIAIEPTPEPIV